MLTGDMLRVHLEAILLHFISGRDCYGYELFRAIEEETKGLLNVKEATLYAVLQRLEQNGAVSSYQGAISEGSKRRYYHITPAGRAQLRLHAAAWRESREIIDHFMSLEGENHGKNT